MYCTYCNHPNVDENKFCENCGKPLVKQQVLPVPPTLTQTSALPAEVARPSKTSWARRLASIGSMIVIYCFFLPWLLVSCSFDVDNRQGIEVSGFELASGTYKINQDASQLGSFLGQNTYDPSTANSAYPLLAIIPLLGAVGLIALSGRVAGSVLAILSGIAGLGGMVLFTIAAIAYGNELNQSMLLKLQFRVGYWGVWFGLLWQVIVAILTVRQRK